MYECACPSASCLCSNQINPSRSMVCRSCQRGLHRRRNSGGGRSSGRRRRGGGRHGGPGRTGGGQSIFNILKQIHR